MIYQTSHEKIRILPQKSNKRSKKGSTRTTQKISEVIEKCHLRVFVVAACFNFWQHLDRVGVKRVGMSKKCYFAVVAKNLASGGEGGEGTVLIYQTSLLQLF